MSATAAQAAIDALLRFNPRQLRGDDGKWIKMDGDDGPPEALTAAGAIEGPAEAPDGWETTGDTSAMALRARAAVAVLAVFGFNPHQLRGPDGKWVKMPTYLRKERRRERDRKRREDKRAERDGGKAAQPWRDTEMPISELLDIAMVNRLDPASPKIQALADDIRKNGITRRLQVEDSPKGLFLGDGHHRLLAAREAGLDKVPVRIFDASPEGRRAANEAMRNDGDNDQLQVGSPAPAPEPINDRAAEVGTSAQRKYREARDRFNREMVDHGQFQVNDNDFDGVDDPALALDLRSLKAALVRGDDLEADEAADRLRHGLAQRYPHVDVPPIPDEADFDPEMRAQRALREALDRYNAEIHSDALEWVAEANEPDVDWSLWGLSDAQGAVFADALNERTARLGAAIQDGVSAAADRAAARLRQLFVETGVRPDHDFNSLPTIEEFREQGRVLRPAPARKDNPLLTGGSSHSERLAQLEQAVATGVWGEEELGQGAMGETKKQLLNDGTTVINKRAKGTWPYGGVDWTAIQQTDAEELSALVGSALGLRSPAVQRVDDTTINMEFVPDATPAFNRYWDRDATDFLRVPGDVLGSDDGLRMGLLDVLIGNPDRHGYNWMVDDDNRLYPIDNGLAFVNLKGTNASDAGRSPFAAEYFITPDGRFKDNILSRRDIQWVREQMEALAPQFQRVGQPAWYTQIQNRLRQLEIRARGGNQHQLPAPQGEVRPE